MDVISEKYEVIDELIERIGDAESLEDTAAVAVELYGVLGFCQGFRGRPFMKAPVPNTKNFPWSQTTADLADQKYVQEYAKGSILATQLKESENET